MGKRSWPPTLGLAFWGLTASLMIVSVARGQTPYIGFAFPAGAQQGTTVQIRLGGQRIDGVSDAIVSGTGVSAKLVEYRRQLSNQEIQLLKEQLRVFRPQPNKRRASARKNAAPKKNAAKNKTQPKKKTPASKKVAARKNGAKPKVAVPDAATQELIARLDKRIKQWINRPACASLSSIAIVEVTVASDAEPGPRELRLITARGVTNPLVFYVGQVPEVARKPMLTSRLQVLGKEQQSLRQRPDDEIEARITVPCTMNGQIASGEVNRYRFDARAGQRLVVTVDARKLIPFIADAVPGWFQPVLTLCDAEGNELEFNDDYRFHPDPTLFFEVPKNGEYVLTINDAIFRGREDFVYRITIGELPFMTSIFPLGGRVGDPVVVDVEGWNLAGTELTLPPDGAERGIHAITARNGNRISNRLPFMRDTLPECFESEANNDLDRVQKVEMPIIINGRIDQSDDWDVFELQGQAGQKIVAEVFARRLESPLDSMLKITDGAGNLLALNDDHEDVGAGVNTHHADSYLMVTLPTDGTYHVHIGDTARNGGKAYAYRLRISPPRPDFELRVVPSSANFRSRASAALTIHAIRKDGFAGDIKLRLKDPPEGFSARNVTLKAAKEIVRFGLRTTLKQTEQPESLTVEGVAKVRGENVVRMAVPAEDRMQAFLWRHLVPAQDLLAVVYNPAYKPPPKRIPDPSAGKTRVKENPGKKVTPATFSKRQVANRLRQLKKLYEEWLLTDAFYNEKVAECETVLE